MHRRATLSLSVFLLAAGGASLASADHLGKLDLLFGDPTAIAPGGSTFSVDVQVITDPVTAGDVMWSPGLWITNFEMDVELNGLALQSIDSLAPGPSWATSSTDETATGFDTTGAYPILPAAQPVGLLRMNLEITESSGPWSITLSEIFISTHFGIPFPTNEEAYSLSIAIPAPAGLALLAGGLGGFRRRRAG